MEIIAECQGWQGGTLIDLGRFTRSHPPEEWDGRLLSAGPHTRAFNVTYRIQGTNDVYGSAGTFDPAVPLPFNLHAVNGWTDCRYFAGCSFVNEPGLAWDYTVDPANPRPPIYFNVYKHMLTDGTMRESRIQPTLDGTHMSAPQASDCGEHVYYSVEAVVGFGSFYAEEIISGRSEALEIMPTCATLEITLVSMYVYGVDDGAPCTIFADCAEDYEAYGVFWFGGSPLTWNNHCDNELCGGGSSSTYTIIDEATNYNWANMSLRKASGGFSRGNNVIRIPFRDQEKILWNFQLKDHDSSSADDSWCGFGINHNLLPKDYTLTELLTLDKDKVIRDRNFEIGSYGCDITLHLRGIPGTP